MGEFSISGLSCGTVAHIVDVPAKVQ